MSKLQAARARVRSIAEKNRQTTDALAQMGGGYGAGRFMRNSTVSGLPLPLLAGGAGILLRRRASKTGFGRAGVMALLGAGAYGAGKIGEQHGEEAGNDGNLFSWEDGEFSTD